MQNPFETPLSESREALAVNREPSASSVVTRATAWFVIVNVVFMGIPHGFLEMFEEFGVELPVVTRFVLAIAFFQRGFWFLSIPFSMFVYFGAEALIRNLAGDRRRWAVVLFWFVLLLVVVVTALSISMPLIQLTKGLS